MEDAVHMQVILNKSLFKAIVRNDIKDFQRLVSLGADVNSEFTINELVRNKLLDDNAVAIINGAEITVDTLIKEKSVEGTSLVDDNEIAAIKNKHYSKVLVLPIWINKIILSSESKLSPLQLAVVYGWKEVIIELIKRGADTNKALGIQGVTILQFMCTAAVFKGKQSYIFDEEIIQLLFDHGADPNIQNISGATSLRYIAQTSDFHIDEMVKARSESEHAECDIRHAKRIERFLINGANPNIKDKYSHCTVLYNIVEHDSLLGAQPGMTHLFLDHGSVYATSEDVLKHPETISMMQEDYGRNYDPKEDIDRFNMKHKQHLEKNGQLIKAVKSKGKSEASTLLNNGASPNIRDKDGLSALHLAVKLGDYDIIELLLSKGANPNIKSWNNGTTPLFNAVISDRADIAELLLKNAANPSVMNTKNLSVLYFSIVNNNEEITKLLLKHGANPDISKSVTLLFNVLNTACDSMKIVVSTLEKVKRVVEFLKSNNIHVDYSSFYKSVDLAEKGNNENTAKKIVDLLDELF